MNIVITGGNSGIGCQTVRGLYGDGHNIIFGSRNQQKNLQVCKSVMQSFPNSNGSLKSFSLDLSKKASIQKFVQFINKQFTYIDILINNAGMIKPQRQLNQMNIEMTMAVNHFGHFYLTYLLFPLIKKAKQARIINVSSMVHLRTNDSPSQDLQANNGWSSMNRYSRSKLANVLFTVGLAKRLSNNPKIKTASLHPGIVDSQFGNGSTLISFFKCCCCCLYVNNETGARTSLHLSRIPFSDIKSGEYYHSNTEIVQKNELANNMNEVDKLWAIGQKLYGISFTL